MAGEAARSLQYEYKAVSIEIHVFHKLILCRINLWVFVHEMTVKFITYTPILMVYLAIQFCCFLFENQQHDQRKNKKCGFLKNKIMNLSLKVLDLIYSWRPIVILRHVGPHSLWNLFHASIFWWLSGYALTLVQKQLEIQARPEKNKVRDQSLCMTEGGGQTDRQRQTHTESRQTVSKLLHLCWHME